MTKETSEMTAAEQQEAEDQQRISPLLNLMWKMEEDHYRLHPAIAAKEFDRVNRPRTQVAIAMTVVIEGITYDMTIPGQEGMVTKVEITPEGADEPTHTSWMGSEQQEYAIFNYAMMMMEMHTVQEDDEDRPEHGAGEDEDAPEGGNSERPYNRRWQASMHEMAHDVDTSAIDQGNVKLRAIPPSPETYQMLQRQQETGEWKEIGNPAGLDESMWRLDQLGLMDTGPTPASGY